MFITLEGPDGSGKTSQIPPLVEFLEQQGLKVVSTREPGGTPIGNQVREILVNMKHKASMHPRTEILLFCSSRAQLVEQVVRPALANNEYVLCDRYADSTLAYQGYGHGVSIEWLKSLLDFATGGLKPDLTFLLDIPAEEGLRRRRNSGGWNRLDDYDLAFHQRVRKGYLEMVQQEPDRWRVIDACRDQQSVQDSLRGEIDKLFIKNRPTSPEQRL
jgi:dTMP kinase